MVTMNFIKFENECTAPWAILVPGDIIRTESKGLEELLDLREAGSVTCSHNILLLFFHSSVENSTSPISLRFTHLEHSPCKIPWPLATDHSQLSLGTYQIESKSATKCSLTSVHIFKSSKNCKHTIPRVTKESHKNKHKLQKKEKKKKKKKEWVEGENEGVEEEGEEEEEVGVKEAEMEEKEEEEEKKWWRRKKGGGGGVEEKVG